MRRLAGTLGSILLFAGLACGEDIEPPPPAAAVPDDDPRCFGRNAAAVLAAEPDPHAAWALVQELAAQMDRASFEACYASEQELASVPYDALSADYLDQIGDSLWMRDEQRELLAQNGFVVLEHIDHLTFESAYANIYDADLPVMVTSDSLLNALHRSFDDILAKLEGEVLKGELELLLAELHDGLAVLDTPPELEAAARDLDVYLAVARSLLTGNLVHAHGGSEPDQAAFAIRAAVYAGEPGELDLFGVKSIYDYSQLEPRGHYADTPLAPYFQAIMWLGRTPLPLTVVPDGGGPVQLNRRGVEATMLLAELLEQGGAQGPRARWELIESVLRQLIGEPDNMSPATLPAFRSDAGITDLASLVNTSDAELFATLGEGQYGVQRILSQIVYTDIGAPPAELPQVFALFGQRFTVDSYVLHAVTYDRITDPATGAKVERMLPHELDVAFALGSNAAVPLLSEELDRYAYHGVLHGLRFLIDAHGEDFWRESFYNSWLDAIRQLGDPSEHADYPAAMRTQAWSRKAIETQLASWAELRHDTIAYTKGSYTGGISCEYPQAYVEPVPSFYARMGEIAAQGLALADMLAAKGHEVPDVTAYFEHMADVMLRLESIASKELDGLALDDDEWEFLRGTIEAETFGCADAIAYNGWYGRLLFDFEKRGHFDPTIADLHTAPTDADGNPVGWVLHAGTGYIRDMVFTVEDCSGVRAYVGPVSSFHRKRTDDYERMTDEAWSLELDETRPSPPAWAQSYVR